MNEQKILDGLKDNDPAILREAAFSAGDTHLEDAVPLLVRLLNSENLGVQEAAEYALRRIRGPEVVNELLPLLRSDEAPIRNISMDILREIGKDCIEPLKDLLLDNDPDLRIFAADILGSTASIEAMTALGNTLLRDPEVNVRYQAAMSLGSLGFPEAANVLNQALNDEEWVQFSIIEALTKIRSESSIMALVKAMDKSSDLVSSMIIEALGEFGNIKAVPLLSKKLCCTCGPLRNKIIKAIVQILNEKSLALYLEKDKDLFRLSLLDALEDEDAAVQDAAAIGLKYVGGEDASEALFKLAETIDPDIEPERLNLMINAMVGIGNSKCLEAALKSSDEHASRLAVEVLARLNDKPAIDLLTKEFWNKDRNTQRSIVAHLVNISDPDDTEFFTKILNESHDGDIIKSALFYFTKHTPPKEVVSKIRELLLHHYPDVRAAALEACIAMGGEEIINYFRQLLNAQDEEGRSMAVVALGRVDLHNSWQILCECLNDQNPKVRMETLKALGSHPSIPREYSQKMLALIDDPVREVRITLIELLGNSKNPEFIKPLLKALEDSDDWVKARAIESLGNMDTDQVVPELTAQLEAENPLVAIKAIEALAKIGGEAAFSAVLSVLEGGNPDLQGPAEEALAAISEGQPG